MKIALIDLDEDKQGCNNKDQTGTYGSVMDAGGLVGSVFNLLKLNMLRLPILFFGYMAAILRRQGHTVNIYSSYPQDEEVVIIATSIIGYRQEIDFARSIRKKKDCIIGFTGAFAKAKPELFLEVGDFVIDGEPEKWALDFDRNINRRGVIRSEWIDDLDALPFPDWNGFPLHKYGYFPLLREKQFLTMLSSRGCPFACPYCQYLPIQGIKWRSRTPESVVEEIAFLKKDFNLRSLLFRDVVFTFDKNRARSIAELILSRQIRLKWGFETRADRIDRDLVKVLKRAGVRFINIGVETPDDATLKKLGRKPIAHNHLVEIINYCESIGIKINAFYILGLPDDNEEKIRSTVRFASKLNTSLAQFGVATPYPGTPFFEEMSNDSRLLTTDWSQYTTYNPVMKLDSLTAEDILRLKKFAYNRYFMRPEWIFKRGLKLLAGL